MASDKVDPLEPKELGTLIVVVGKARNLPNKSRFGKQDPFCTVRVAEDKQKTKPIKRGGQHPEWDEELRFTIIEDLEEVLARSDSKDALSASTSSTNQPTPPAKDGSLSGHGQGQGVTTAAALATKGRRGPMGKKSGGKKMVVTCYADDAKEPELIGECVVPIDDVLKKGEVDEWYEFLYKEKYSGEVYLELTFYSNDAPPVKRNPSIQKYGQSSVLGSASSSLSSRPSIASLSTSSSVAGMNLYIPPYLQPARALSPAPSTVAIPPSGSFASLGLPQGSMGHGRNQSVPSLYGAPSSLSSVNSISTLHAHDPVDALSRPMSSMSIASSASRPLPQAGPSQPPAQAISHSQTNPHLHRHSLGEAPWANLLPQNQSQYPPSHTPVSRPVSATDSYGQSHWDNARLAATTPLARPASSMQYDGRAPSPVPSSLMPGALPDQPVHRHAHSFSGIPAGQAHPSTYLKPATPAPPAPSHSAPPIPQQQQPPMAQAPMQQSHYPLPTSSFPALTHQSSDPYRASTPQPQHSHGYQAQDPYRSSTPQPGHHQAYAPVYQDPVRASTPLPPIPPQGQQQDPYRSHTPTPTYQAPPQPNFNHISPQSHSDPYAYQHAPAPHLQSNHGYSPPIDPHQQYHPQSALPPSASSQHQWPQVPTPPRRMSTPTLPTPHHQHQQHQQQYQTPPQPQHPAQAQAQAQPNAQGYVPWYQQTRPTPPAPPVPAPPPVPDYNRPAPAPPPPPRSAMGYYPSDELYALQRQQDQQTQVQTPPRAPAGWQSTVQEQEYRPPYATPPALAPAAAALSSSSSLHITSTIPASASVSAGRQDWKSYMASLSTTSNSGSFPARSPSPQPPQPPVPVHSHSQPQVHQDGQQEWYTPPPSLPSSIRPPDGWSSGVHVSNDGHQWKR